MKTLILSMVLLSAMLSPALAQGPRLRFDVPQTLAVRDVTTSDFAVVHPDERMIEARVTISMLLERGSADDVRELVHRVESSTVAAQVVDFSPKTQLASQVVGLTNIQQEQKQDIKLGAEVGASGYGFTLAKAGGDYQQQQRQETQFQQLPALDLLTASGTVDRGRGVYFKLKPSPRTTLEGAYEYVMVLRVPKHWRAGLLYVGSEAIGSERGMLGGSDELTTVGRGRFVVAIYQQADVVAQRAAMRYAQAENAVRQLAVAKRSDLERRMYPSPLHKLGVTRDRALAKDWLDTALFRSANDEVLQYLPGELRVAVENFQAARRELGELNYQSRIARTDVAG